jgi:hypothetical protein
MMAICDILAKTCCSKMYMRQKINVAFNMVIYMYESVILMQQDA